jgi:putative ABC transport system permease protein
MNWRTYVRSRLPRLAVSPEREIEIVEELAAQLEATYEGARTRGASEGDAVGQAAAEVPDWKALALSLAGIERPQARGPAPGMIATGAFSGFAQDVRYATRSLMRAPGFAAATIVTLALGIGATTTVGSAAVGVLHRPLPFLDADRLVLITGSAVPGFPHTPLSVGDVMDLAENASLASMGAWSASPEMKMALGGDRPEEIQFAIATSGLFPTLGIEPLAGRWFQKQEDEPGATPVAVVDSRLWHRHFGSARPTELIGKTMVLNDQTYDIVGVLPEGFQFASFQRDVDVWLPLGRDPNQGRRFSRGTRYLGGIARLAPGVTLARASDAADEVARRLAAQFPDQYRNRHFDVMDLGAETRRDLRGSLVLLLGTALLMLVIACVNVANLIVMRASGRSREFAVRVSLGASRGRLARQLFAETATMVVGATVLGYAVSGASTGAIATLLERTPNPLLPYAFDASALRIDPMVSAVIALLSIVVCLAFAQTPLWRTAAANPADALRSSGVGAAGSSRRWRRGLIAVEVALSVMVLTGAGLLARSVSRLFEVDPGFRADQVLTVELNLRPSEYREPNALIGFYDRLLPAISAEPGVASVSLTEMAPLSGSDQSTSVFVEGRPLGEPATRPRVHQRSVGDSYFSTMGIPVTAGRAFTTSDRAESQHVTMVNETLARLLWPGEDPIGKRFSLDFEAMQFFRDRPPLIDLPSGWRVVVGVVGDVKHADLTSHAVPEAYQPLTQRPPRMATLVVRGTVGPEVLERTVRRAVARVDSQQPVGRVRAFSDLIAASTARPRSSAALLAVLAGLALGLAAIGIYAVVAYAMTLRVPEIGLRIALGADGWSIARLIGAEGLLPGAAGLAIGLAAALALSRVIESLLYQVSSRDPLTFGASALTIMLATIAACAIPVWRAVKLDPVAALRAE